MYVCCVEAYIYVYTSYTIYWCCWNSPKPLYVRRYMWKHALTLGDSSWKSLLENPLEEARMNPKSFEEECP